jgi:hypothetical protein
MGYAEKFPAVRVSHGFLRMRLTAERHRMPGSPLTHVRVGDDQDAAAAALRAPKDAGGAGCRGVQPTGTHAHVNRIRSVGSSTWLFRFSKAGATAASNRRGPWRPRSPSWKRAMGSTSGCRSGRWRRPPWEAHVASADAWRHGRSRTLRSAEASCAVHAAVVVSHRQQ